MRFLAAGYLKCYRAFLLANLKTTLIGIPLAWLLWVLGLAPISWGLSSLELGTHPLITVTAAQTAFFGGTRPTEWTNIGSAIAWIVLLIPFFLGSVWIERRVIIKRFPNEDKKRVSKAVIIGNAASYVLLLFLGIYVLVNTIGDYPRQKERFESFRVKEVEYRKANKTSEDVDADAPNPQP